MKKMFSILVVFIFWATTSMAAVGILVTWNANTESDLSGYNIYDVVGSGTKVKVGSVSVMTSPSFTISNVVDGLHTVTVTAFDTAGNESAPSDPANVTIDTTPPTIPAKPSVTVSGSTVTLTWTAVTSSDLFGYGIYDNGLSVGSIGVMTSPTFTLSGLGDGVHSFTIDSVDTTGNRSAKSAATSVTIDMTAPAKPTSVKIQVTK